MSKKEKFTEIVKEPRIGGGHPGKGREVKNPKSGNKQSGSKKK